MRPALTLTCVLIACLQLIAQSEETISFDNLPSSKAISNAYEGFNWQNVTILDASAAFYENSGYVPATTSAPNIAFNTFGIFPFGFSLTESNATFDLTSLNITAVWNKYNIIIIRGYLDGEEVECSDAITVNNAFATTVDLSWKGIDQVQFFFVQAGPYGGSFSIGEHIAIDDIVIKRNTWKQEKIGYGAGSVSINDQYEDDMTLEAAGFALPNSDNQQFVFQEVCGNSEMTVQVASVSQGGFAGIQFRAHLEADSPLVGLKTRKGNYVWSQERENEGTLLHTQRSTRPGQPGWLRLIRNGNEFSGYASDNGIEWVLIFQENMALSECLLVGLFVEGLSPNSTSSANFKNIALSKEEVAMATPETNEDWAEAARFPQNSKAALLAFRAAAELQIRPWPNPTTEWITIELPSLDGASIDISIYNAAGQMLKTHREEAWSLSSYQLNVSDFPAGMYWVSVSAEEVELGKSTFAIVKK